MDGKGASTHAQIDHANSIVGILGVTSLELRGYGHMSYFEPVV